MRQTSLFHVHFVRSSTDSTHKTTSIAITGRRTGNGTFSDTYLKERFPAIWLPTKDLLDLRALLRHRHQWVGLRVKNTKCAAGHCLGE
jgi:hypothetical protein